MEEPPAHHLKSSRSRSNTPLPAIDHDPASHRLANSSNTPLHMETEIIQEETESQIFTSPPAHRTRNALKNKTPKVNNAISLEDAVMEKHQMFLSTEEVQNIKNYSYEYEQITTSQTLLSNNSRSFVDAGRDGSRVHSSMSGSEYSNESFAESVLADSSRLSVEDGIQHLPYRLYKCAVEYWNKYPKTDYTYSRLSKDRVELAPGQIAVPNMSRPSLHSVRHGSSTQDLHTASSTSSLISESDLRQRLTSSMQRSYQNSRRVDTMSDSEVDETDNWHQTYAASKKDNKWWITRLIVAIWTSIVTVTNSVYCKVTGRGDNARYYANNYYTSVMNNKKSKYTSVMESAKKKRFWIPLLLLLPILSALLYWWYCGIPVGNQKEEIRTVHAAGDGKFELTEDIINEIVLRVKQSLPPPPSPEPVVIEKIIETQNVVDQQLLSEQQRLIDKLSGEIVALKSKDNVIDEDMLSKLVSGHVTNTVVQILGLQSTSGSDIRNALFNQQKEYVDHQMLGLKDALMMNLNNLDHRIRKDITDMKSQSSIQGGAYVQTSGLSDAGCQCDDMIRKIVKDALLIYDADKTGLVDYAMESAGGHVTSTRCTQAYQTNTAVISLFGIPLWHPSNSPRTVLTPGASPGDCWAFQGFPGYLVITLFKRIQVTGFTMEHVSSLLSPHGSIESAPKKFTVLGLQDETDKEPIVFGTYEYRNDSTPVQYFEVMNNIPSGEGVFPGHDVIELRIESNHGNPVYTCLYRFRVHGDPIDDEYFKQNFDK